MEILIHTFTNQRNIHCPDANSQTRNFPYTACYSKHAVACLLPDAYTIEVSDLRTRMQCVSTTLFGIGRVMNCSRPLCYLICKITKAWGGKSPPSSSPPHSLYIPIPPPLSITHTPIIFFKISSGLFKCKGVGILFLSEAPFSFEIWFFFRARQEIYDNYKTYSDPYS